MSLPTTTWESVCTKSPRNVFQPFRSKHIIIDWASSELICQVGLSVSLIELISPRLNNWLLTPTLRQM